MVNGSPTANKYVRKASFRLPWNEESQQPPSSPRGSVKRPAGKTIKASSPEGNLKVPEDARVEGTRSRITFKRKLVSPFKPAPQVEDNIENEGFTDHIAHPRAKEVIEVIGAYFKRKVTF